MEIIGYFLAIAIGVSLGLIGGGGSILAVPVFHQDERRVVAVLQALNKSDGRVPFDETDVKLLEAFASLISGLVARTALFEDVKREQCRATAMLMCANALHDADLDARTKALRATRAGARRRGAPALDDARAHGEVEGAAAVAAAVEARAVLR